MIIECDFCKETFELESSKMGAAVIEGLSVKYFSCPACKYKYPFMLEDKEQREYHKQITSIQQEIRIKHALGKSVSPAKLRQLNRLHEVAKEHYAVLRDKYNTAVTTQLNQSGLS